MLKALNRTSVRLTGFGSPTGTTLARRFDPRHNSLTLMRLFLAVVVAIVHASAIGWQNQPKLGGEFVGHLAVDGFFVISGFLVARSAMRLPTLRRFVWHRFLRIMPGFWVCLLVVAFAVAPAVAWLQGRPPGSVLRGEDSAVAYVVNNVALLIRQWDISGLLAGAGDEAAMNGALWTLWYEALCYLMVAGLVVVGLLRRRGRAVPFLVRVLRGHGVLVLTALVWVWLTAQSLGVLTVGPAILPRFLLLFLLGTLGLVYAHRITFTWPLIGVAALTWLAALVVLPDYRVVGGPGFAYLLLWAMVALPWRQEPPADLSYGIYVYHWPVQVLLAQIGLTQAGRWSFTLVTLAAAAMLALVSWYLIEAPALARKNAAWVGP